MASKTDDEIQAEVREMARGDLEYWSVRDGFPNHMKAAWARAEIYRRESAERARIVRQQQRLAWLSVAAAGIAAIATVALAALAALQLWRPS